MALPFLCRFQPVMRDHRAHLRLHLCRCNSHWAEGFLLPLSKIHVVIFSLPSLFETDTYNQASLCFIPPWDVSDPPGPPWKHPAIFRGVSVDYGQKSISRAGWISCEDRHVGKVTSPIIVRNLRSFCYVRSILGPINGLSDRHWRESGRRFLPVIAFLAFSLRIQ
jgi:hypothetical protein